MPTQPIRWRSILALFTTVAQLVLVQTSTSGSAVTERPASVEKSANPFGKFVGEWTLKDDSWTQNWGQGTEHLKIPHHHTVCQALNTDNSLLAVVDGPAPVGHIFWTYNPVTKEVRHLSSFGSSRIGVGQGNVNENGDVTLKVSFEGEPPGTHRIYTYRWISADEYELSSTQYDQADKPTGGFYGGTFVRIPKTESR